MTVEDLIKAIIKQQSMIIGERLAIDRAADSGVVTFNSPNIEDVTVTEAQPQAALDKLISSYEVLFGRASVEVCIDSLRKFPAEQVSPVLPEKLKNSL